MKRCVRATPGQMNSTALSTARVADFGSEFDAAKEQLAASRRKRLVYARSLSVYQSDSLDTATRLVRPGRQLGAGGLRRARVEDDDPEPEQGPRRARAEEVVPRGQIREDEVVAHRPLVEARDRGEELGRGVCVRQPAGAAGHGRGLHDACARRAVGRLYQRHGHHLSRGGGMVGWVSGPDSAGARTRCAPQLGGPGRRRRSAVGARGSSGGDAPCGGACEARARRRAAGRRRRR